MARTEVRITGFGGQGVVLTGHIIGHACAIEAGGEATMIQSFGPEARGSACSVTLAIQDSEVLFPYILKPRYLVALSSDGYEKYRQELDESGTLIYEADLVKPGIEPGQSAFGIPSTRIAESLGRVIVQNIVMLGFFTAVTRITTREQMREAVRHSVPPGTIELNLKAFEAGLSYFDENFGDMDETEAAKEVTV